MRGYRHQTELQVDSVVSDNKPYDDCMAVAHKVSNIMARQMEQPIDDCLAAVRRPIAAAMGCIL